MNRIQTAIEALPKGQELRRKEDGAMVTVLGAGISRIAELGGGVPRLNLSEENGHTYSMNLINWAIYYEKLNPHKH